MRSLDLLCDHELPPQYREVAIVRGYRPQCITFKQCFQSAFLATNETLNFWTHFLPTIYFCWRLTELSESMNINGNPYTWAFAAYMLTVCIYPFISAFAHLFYSLSVFARHVWFFMDYGALSFYSFGAGLIYRAYAFPVELLNTAFSDVFLYVCALNTVTCTLMACTSRFIDSPLWVKILRLGAFVLPWIWDTIPLLYRFFHPDSLAEDSDGETRPHYLRLFAFSLMIGFFYATHFPERLLPGKFDIIGHSHQLLHICGILATHEQMSGALRDLRSRRQAMEASGMTPSFWCIDVLFGVLLTNLAIILIFSLYAWRVERSSQKTKKN